MISMIHTPLTTHPQDIMASLTADLLTTTLQGTASPYQGLDLLSSMPPEIIIRLVAHLFNTQEHFLLSQVSPHFRQLLRTN